MRSRVRIEGAVYVSLLTSGMSASIEARGGGRRTGPVVDDLLHCLLVVCSRCKVHDL